MEGNKIAIHWDKYGEYEMLLDVASMTMTGCKKGQPDNWRKATFVRALHGETVPAHDHAHHH